MWMSSTQRFIVRAWDEHVAHEARIEAAFDRLGYPAGALEPRESSRGRV